MKKITTLLLGILFVAISCSKNEESKPKYSISVKDITLKVSDKITVTPSVNPAKSVTDFTYKSSKTNIFTVDKAGVVTGISEGEGVLTVSSETLEATTSVKVVVSGVKVEKVTFELKSFSYFVGQEGYQRISVFPKNATSKKITWKTSDKNVISIDKDGKMKAISKGEALITASIDGKEATIKITVKPKPPVQVASISISSSKNYKIEEYNKTRLINLVVGDNDKLLLTITPENAENKKVKWVSSNSEVVSVNSKGEIKSLKHSVTPALITVTSEDGSKTDNLYIFSKKINSYINAYDGAVYGTSGNGYVTAKLTSSIMNSSNKSIKVTNLKITSNKTSKLVLNKDINTIIYPGKSLEKGFNVTNEYKPNYKFTWEYEFNNKTYIISVDNKKG